MIKGLKPLHFQMDLTARGVLRLFLPLTLSTLLAGIYLYVHFSNISEASFQENLRVIALSKKGQIESYLQERRGDLQILTRLAPVWQRLQGAGGPLQASDVEQRLDQQLRNFATTYGYRDIQLLDTSLNSRGGQLAQSITREQKIGLETALGTGATTLVDFHIDEDGARVFGMAAPVYANGRRGGTPIGVIYVELEAAVKLDPAIATWPGISRTAEILLFENDGDEVLFLTPPKIVKDNLSKGFFRRPKSPDLISAKLLRAPESPILNGIDYRGVEVIGAGVTIAGTPWFLLAKMDHDEASDAVDRLGWGIALVITLVLILLAAAARLLWRLRGAEMAAKEAELGTHFLAAQKTSIDGYLVIDESGAILECNEALETMSGYSAEELRSMRLADVNAEFNPAEIASKLENIRSAGAARFKTRWRTKTGDILFIEVGVAFIKTASAGAFQAFLHDVGQERAYQRYIERLNTFYLFLSKVNIAIFNAKEPWEMLDAFCDAAVEYGGFKLAWAGMLDEAGDRIRPVVARGPAASYVENLVISTDPALPTSHGPAARSFLEGRVIEVNDVQNQSFMSPWHEIARAHDLNSTAVIPILLDKKTVAIVCFYASEKQFFDAEVRTLLEEVSRNASHAWRLIDSATQREAAIQAREQSESRFARLLDATPIPIQIHDRNTLEMRLINRAHERTFGYALEEIREESQWFERAYPDAETAWQMRNLWHDTIEQMVFGGPGAARASPELTLRCKDGSTRILRGYGAVVGDEVIALWQDLTEIKRATEELEKDQKRFRAMIEHSLTGIYVTQNNTIVYANPRLCEMTGWTQTELLGRDSLEVFGNVPEAREKIISGRSKILAGARSVAQEYPVLTRDGRHIVLGSHASELVWDGQPASVIMCQDVTERLAENEKIAAHLKELEISMKGTLQAVATMVDLRDPYTAGHERRVGLVAADIAREMGWAEDRCTNLELIGLVHDIGKIAVPAEILSKPTRLTKLEFDMIKAHAEKGYEILKDVPFRLPIAEIIRQHHERLDGSGYPRGLHGDQILPEARVLAVADVLESMASHRPYRPALGIDAAVREIESHRGVWFDNEVVDAVLRLVREKTYRLPA